MARAADLAAEEGYAEEAGLTDLLNRTEEEEEGLADEELLASANYGRFRGWPPRK